jgi:hypothetical protein
VTVNEIIECPTWIVPAVLWTVASVLLGIVVKARMDVEGVLRSQFAQHGMNVSADQIERFRRAQEQFSWISYGASGITPVIAILLTALVLFGIIRATTSADVRWRSLLGVVSHSFMPIVLSTLLVCVIAAQRTTIAPADVDGLAMSNLGFLASSDSPAFVRSLLGDIDVYVVWTLVLVVLGCAAIPRMGRWRAAAVVAVPWLVIIAIRAAAAQILAP